MTFIPCDSLCFLTLGAADIGSGRSVGEGVKRPVLVFFIGGVTYAEISALRFLSSKDESKYCIPRRRIIPPFCFYANFIA